MCAEAHSLLLSLAPDEVYPAGPINQAAGALLPHPFTLTPEAEASLRDYAEAVYSLLHLLCPRGRWELPTTVSYGARTFLSVQ